MYARLKQYPKKELQESHGEREEMEKERKVTDVTHFFTVPKEEVKLYGY